MKGQRTAGRLVRIARRAVDLVLVAFVVAILAAVVAGQALPRLGHPVYVVGGPSMEPAIPVGALIVTAPVAATDLRPGDVVTMRVGPAQAIFTHRIVRTVERDGHPWIETKGDANAGPDPSIVPATVVIGRVAVAIPLAGYLLALLSSAVGVLFVLGVAGSLLAAAWLLETFEEETVDEATPATVGGIAPDGRRVVVPRRLIRARSAGALVAHRQARAPYGRLGAGLA